MTIRQKLDYLKKILTFKFNDTGLDTQRFDKKKIT